MIKILDLFLICTHNIHCFIHLNFINDTHPHQLKTLIEYVDQKHQDKSVASYHYEVISLYVWMNKHSIKKIIH